MEASTAQQSPPSDEEVPIDREELAALAKKAAEELPSLMDLMATHIDGNTFLDEDAVPPEDEE